MKWERKLAQSVVTIVLQALVAGTVPCQVYTLNNKN